MAITQIDPTLGSGSEYKLEAVSVWANSNAFGRDRCSLTEWDTTTVPELAEGSIFETGGAYYQVDSDTAITVGAVSDGFVFILVNTTVPAVPTLQFTNSIPVWDAAKFGYYDTGTNYKALPFRVYKSSSTYVKWVLDHENRLSGQSRNMFEVYRTTSYSIAGDAEITNIWSGTTYNYSSCFNTTTGRFTPIENGSYSFNLGALLVGGGSYGGAIGLVKNSTGSIVVTGAGSGSDIAGGISATVYLTTNDYVSLWGWRAGSGPYLLAFEGSTTSNIIFSCDKVG